MAGIAYQCNSDVLFSKCFYQLGDTSQGKKPSQYLFWLISLQNYGNHRILVLVSGVIRVVLSHMSLCNPDSLNCEWKTLKTGHLLAKLAVCWHAQIKSFVMTEDEEQKILKVLKTETPSPYQFSTVSLKSLCGRLNYQCIQTLSKGNVSCINACLWPVILLSSDNCASPGMEYCHNKNCCPSDALQKSSVGDQQIHQIFRAGWAIVLI